MGYPAAPSCSMANVTTMKNAELCGGHIARNASASSGS